MAVFTSNELKTLDLAFGGQPFVTVRANLLDIEEYAYDGTPMTLVAQTVSPTNSYVKIGPIVLQLGV